MKNGFITSCFYFVQLLSFFHIVYRITLSVDENSKDNCYNKNDNVIKLSKTCQRVPAINQSYVGMIVGFCPLSEVP